MNCNICNNEFKYEEGLKFCPYCGSKLSMQFVASEQASEDVETKGGAALHEAQVGSESVDVTNSDFTKEEVKEEEALPKTEVTKTKGAKLHDTLEMPAITDEDIRRDKRERRALRRAKVAADIKSGVKSKLFIIPVSALLVLSVIVFLGYKFLLSQNVDEGRIKEDLIGKTIVLPKGTNFEIKRSFIKQLTITNRVDDKSKALQYIDISLTLNNDNIEVKGPFRVTYKKQGTNSWKINDKVELQNGVAVKPVAGLEEAAFTTEVKKQNIKVNDETIALSDESVKGIKLLDRKPSFDQGKEDITVEVSLDSGVVSAKGNLICNLVFVDESWVLQSVNRASNTDFALSLSGALSDEVIAAQIKKKPMQETVSYTTVFAGQGFRVNDKYTNSFTLTDKSFDGTKKQLSVTAKRENVSGPIKTTLTTGYVFSVSLKGINLNSTTKSKVENVSVTDISKDTILAQLVGAQLRVGSFFLWGDMNHAITADEANSFTIDQILSKKNALNVKYVYGNLTYKGKKNKATPIVAIYSVKEDGSGGYSWKLESAISSESDLYQYYSKENISGT